MVRRLPVPNFRRNFQGHYSLPIPPSALPGVLVCALPFVCLLAASRRLIHLSAASGRPVRSRVSIASATASAYARHHRPPGRGAASLARRSDKAQKLAAVIVGKEHGQSPVLNRWCRLRGSRRQRPLSNASSASNGADQSREGRMLISIVSPEFLDYIYGFNAIQQNNIRFLIDFALVDDGCVTGYPQPLRVSKLLLI